jgi:pyruvate/2-oxoglutarate dehydrogenase complex dihydrolipoamide dehydrogenase (E3) component
VLLERSSRLGGQIALAGAAPAHAETARTLVANYERMLAERVDVRLEADADSESVEALKPAAVVVAAGAEPYRPPLELGELDVRQAWEILAGERPRGARVVVADWGGDPSGLAVAELLDLEGNDVTLATASATVGEALHQYVRSLYLARLYRAGVRFEQHLELVGAEAGRALFVNVFAPEVDAALPADVLVLALGRVPASDLAPSLAGRAFPVEEAGDCLSPRSLEEAILEGTLAARRVAVRA